MRTRFVVAVLPLAVGFVAANAWAQNGVAWGRVLDESGRAVPEASVTLEYLGLLVGEDVRVGLPSVDRKGTRAMTDDEIEGLGRDAEPGEQPERRYETETDDEGQYSLIVSPGRYRITVSKEDSRERYQGATLEHSITPGPRTRVPDIRIVTLEAARAAAVESHEVLGPLRRAMELTQAGRLEEAEVAYKEALAKDPSVIEARYNLGIIYLGRKDYAAAEGQLQKMIELSPETGEAYPALSRVYAEQGDTKRALEVMAKGAALEPEDAAMQFNLGVLYYNAQRTEEAEETLLKAETLDPANVRIQYMLGTLALNRSDLEAAAGRFEKYLAEAPADAAYREAAKTMLEQLRPALSPES